MSWSKLFSKTFYGENVKLELKASSLDETTVLTIRLYFLARNIGCVTFTKDELSNFLQIVDVLIDDGGPALCKFVNGRRTLMFHHQAPSNLLWIQQEKIFGGRRMRRKLFVPLDLIRDVITCATIAFNLSEVTSIQDTDERYRLSTRMTELVAVTHIRKASENIKCPACDGDYAAPGHACTESFLALNGDRVNRMLADSLTFLDKARLDNDINLVLSICKLPLVGETDMSIGSALFKTVQDIVVTNAILPNDNKYFDMINCILGN